MFQLMLFLMLKVLRKKIGKYFSFLPFPVTQLKVADQHKLHATAVIGLLELYLKGKVYYPTRSSFLLKTR